MPKWCNDDVMVTALLRRRQTDVRSDLGSIDILHTLHFYNLLTVAAMSDDDSELMQMQALWNDAKQELNRLRKLKKVEGTIKSRKSDIFQRYSFWSGMVTVTVIRLAAIMGAI